ncbi:MAG: hypothetical protein JXA99_15860 [Candidatus Lokiarchaeota archaeon]|nr:hypothetical protein [Candidatus Lokiarchaeota archaeon]
MDINKNKTPNMNRADKKLTILLAFISLYLPFIDILLAHNMGMYLLPNLIFIPIMLSIIGFIFGIIILCFKKKGSGIWGILLNFFAFYICILILSSFL